MAHGSSANSEARIDLIAQAWAVLSGVAPPDLQRLALQAMQTHLVDDEAGLIRLLDPPLVDAQPSAGYIQAYPTGVRENGSQYSHAGVWALMAQARFHADPAHALAGPGEGADLAYRYFTYLSPAHRSRHPVSGPAYAIEPYVMAGDLYSQPPYVGRAGADAAPEATAARCRESAARPLCPGELLSWPDLPSESCFVIALAHRPGYVRQRTDDKRWGTYR